ncbi:MAG: gamma-glutamyl-phosphate reductase, partial [Oscillospiraceae bacterium]|nr:gamma-glutamyl-phosphate reductase [Oscillospiraceae bacterium]
MEQITVLELGKRAKAVKNILAAASPKQKNDALAAIADALVRRTDEIITANKVDLENAVKNNMSKAMQD